MSAAVRAALVYLVSWPLRLLDAIGAVYSSGLGVIRPTTYLWGDIRSQRALTRTVRVSRQVAGSLVSLEFHAPNSICQWRAKTFWEKEPETLAWIDAYGGSGALFDIGANVGLYSVYYAVTKPGRVYAFEPSVFNLAILARNVHVNHVAKKIHIVPNPLSSANGFADFAVQSFEAGGALSAFGVAHGQDGKPLQPVMTYLTHGFTLDGLMDRGVLEPPALIKVDVDGIEHLILKGGEKTLARPDCRSVLIEVNEQFVELSSVVTDVLTAAGFKRHESEQATAGNLSKSGNQIWSKSPLVSGRD